MHGSPFLALRIVGLAVGMNLLQQPSHVAGHGAHGLHTFGVESGLSLLATIDDIPVLRSDHGHVHHLEGHVHGLKGCGSSSTAAHTDGCGGLVHDFLASREEHALNERQHRAIGLAVIDWRADDERICRVEFLGDAVAHVIVEHSAS